MTANTSGVSSPMPLSPEAPVTARAVDDVLAVASTAYRLALFMLVARICPLGRTATFSIDVRRTTCAAVAWRGSITAAPLESPAARDRTRSAADRRLLPPENHASGAIVEKEEVLTRQLGNQKGRAAGQWDREREKGSGEGKRLYFPLPLPTLGA